MNKIYRSRAPLRLGLAGGGTDVSPYSDIHGGAILNATISLYAYVDIEVTNDGIIHFEAKDLECIECYPIGQTFDTDGKLNLLKGVYNRIMKDHPFEHNGLKIMTLVQAPPGSGLGSSSTLVVALIGAFVGMLNLPMGEYDIAHYAYDIERVDLQLAGGKQDQYAATFGGFNYMEFYGNDKTIVNPLRIKPEYIYELEKNIVLYYTSKSRQSADIIQEQVKNVRSNNAASIEAMHQLKKQSVMMKEALLRGELDQIGKILDFGHNHKKNMATQISNENLDKIYTDAIRAGATGGKISGAGGGGFMMFYCPGTTRYDVIKALEKFRGQNMPFLFTREGLTYWTGTIGA
ncbi:MAG TPA: dehydrogenase [Saprospiraceae bacterium]|nr:dehydrogenase [Saprospiraceae bacterium]HRO09236.1 dehydrogenase [Saprospiraceae bacterium]HRP42598.1 dehydrogenase [Saprospiraceae bacterium]